MPWCTSFYILLHVTFVLHSVTFSPAVLFSCIASLHSTPNHSFHAVFQHIPNSSCLSFLPLFPLQLSSHPLLFHLNLVNYSLSFSFKAKIKFCFNICPIQITNTIHTAVCFAAHKRLNLILYTITSIPILDTWYCFVCLCCNGPVSIDLCHLWYRCVCSSY